MNNSKVFHPINEYTCGEGKLELNIYNGSYVYIYPLLSIGLNTYNLNVSLVYNSRYSISDFNGFKIGFGNGFKLDIEEYLFPYQNSFNISGFNNLDYVYIDSKWCIHRFIKYKIIVKNNQPVDVYYDESGTGLKLEIGNGYPLIYDEAGNELLFCNNRLVEIRSSLDSLIVKKIEYINNDLVCFYDNRKQSRIISFSYTNHLLQNVSNTLTNESIQLLYKNSNITNVIHHYGNKARCEHEFTYNNLKLEYIINSVDLEALKLEYNNTNKLDKISIGYVNEITKTSFLDSSKYCGEEVIVGDSFYVSDKDLVFSSASYEMPNNSVTSSYSYSYYNSYTKAIDENDTIIRYSFDTSGRLLSNLEESGQYDFYSLEREEGYLLSQNGTSSIRFNGKYAVCLNSNSNSYVISNSINSPFSVFKETITEEKDKFVLSFYVMFINNNYTNRVINLECSFSDISDNFTNKVILNRVSSGSFQKVVFYLDMNKKQVDLTSFTISVDDLSETLYIWDVYIKEGSSPTLLIDNISPDNNHDNGNKVREIKYGSILYIDNDIYSIYEDFYLTSEDIEATYRSLDMSSVFYDFYYNNKTKIKSVSCVYLENSDYTFSIIRGTPNYHYFLSDYIGKDELNKNYWLIKEIQNNLVYSQDEGMYYFHTETKTCLMYECDRNKRIGIQTDFDDIVDKTIYSESVGIYLNGLFYYEGKIENVYGDEDRTYKIKNYKYGNLDYEHLSHYNGNITKGYLKYYNYSSDYELLESIENNEYDDSHNAESNVLEDHITDTQVIKTYTYDSYLKPRYVFENGVKKEYNYDQYNRLISIGFLDANNNVISINYIDYNKKDLLNVLKNKNNTYGFLYNAYNDVSRITINKSLNTLIKNKKVNGNLEVESICYNDNLLNEKLIYDKYGNLIQENNNGNIINFTYENNSLSPLLKRVTSYNDPYTNNNVTYVYDDLLGKTTKTISNYSSLELTDKTSTLCINSGNSRYKEEIVNMGSGYKINNYINDVLCDELSYLFKFDYFSRLKEVLNTYYYDSNTCISVLKELKYNHKMLSPSGINYTVSCTCGEDEDVASITYANTYDGDNIVSVYESGERFNKVPFLNDVTKINLSTKNYTYSYDSFNRITSESCYDDVNEETLYSINYQYGSISQMIEKVYCDNTLTKEFNYSNGKLISYINNGITNNISYDRFGNIISIGSVSYSYNDRNLLSSVIINNNEVMFSYNYVGIRTSKETSNKLVKYYTNGTKIIGEDWISNNQVTNKFRYFYNSEGICGIYYNQRYYQLIKDSLGNVSKIMHYGFIIGEYSYDAWGNVSISKSSNITIDEEFVVDNNPFRYKGYYYDIETNLYYLINRYYSPEIYLFISPDSTNYLDVYSINGLNQYCYCLNNPVMYVDEKGTLAISLALLIGGALFGAITGFGFDVGKQLINNGGDFSSINWGEAVNSTIVGFALGFSFAMGVVYLGPVLASLETASNVVAGIAFGVSVGVSFGAGSIGYAIEEWMNNESPELRRAMFNGALVALEGINNFIFGGIAGSVGNVGTKGKFLKSKEWYAKLVFRQEFTLPFKYVIDLIRKKL